MVVVIDAPRRFATAEAFEQCPVRDMRSVSRFGLAVRRQAGKRKDLGSILLASAVLSLQKGCGLWTLSCEFVHHFLLKH